MSALQAAGKPGAPVACTCCGHTFRQDPPFEVWCPVESCAAKPGQYCKRPSGHSGPLVAFHRERDLAALAAGFYDHCGTGGCGPNTTSERAREILRGEGFVDETLKVSVVSQGAVACAENIIEETANLELMLF